MNIFTTITLIKSEAATNHSQQPPIVELKNIFFILFACFTYFTPDN